MKVVGIGWIGGYCGDVDCFGIEIGMLDNLGCRCCVVWLFGESEVFI